MRQVLSPRGCTHAFPHSLAFLVFHDRQVFPSRANGLTFMASENLPIRAGGERKRGGLRDRFPGLCRSRACGALWIRLIFPPYPWLSIPARSVGWTSEDLRTQPDDPHIIFPRSGAHVLPSGLFFLTFRVTICRWLPALDGTLIPLLPSHCCFRQVVGIWNSTK